MITVCRLLAVRHWILRRSIFVTATRKTCGPNKHISQLNARRVYAPITLAQVRFKCTVAGQQNERNVAPHGFYIPSKCAREGLTTPPQSYAAGEAELETIDNAIEYGEIAIDKLSLAVKRADFLNGHPEQQLVNIEQDLKQLGPQPGSGESKP